LTGKFRVGSRVCENIAGNGNRFPELIERAQGTDGATLYRTLLVLLASVSIMSCAKAESGLASFYDGVGRSGEMTCAHRTRPLGSMITVTYNGHTIRCRVNDRGPFKKGRVIDVSTSAARALGMIEAGVVLVSLE
jgi:rare lipoprotein A